jgi:protein-L-isoaspartate O-methyltransferase
VRAFRSTEATARRADNVGEVLVVVAVGDAEEARGRDELRRRGAATIDRREVGAGRTLLHARFPPERSADGVVAELRSSGWSATARPLAGGHLTAWLANNGPNVISDRLCVCFPWSEFDRSSGPDPVDIDPGRSFGTGSHPSTRLLLVELARRIGGVETVLDVGCGSGVLAVSAARLGANVVATDIEPAACAATRANAERNGLADRVAVTDRPVEAVAGCFDVVVANIGAAALISLAPALRERLAPGGWLGLSGLSPAQVSLVTAAQQGLTLDSLRRDEDWAALVLRHDPRVR